MSQTPPPPETPPPSGILRSNVDQVDASPPPPARPRFPLGVFLVGLLGVALGAGGVLLLLSVGAPVAPKPASAPAPPADAARAVPTVAPAVAAGRRSNPGGPTAPLPDVNGISCDALESTLFHIHLHLAIFIDGQEQAVPLGIGIGQPWQVSDSDEGPFVDDGTCFYWIHTHTDDGVIHIESPVRRRFTLGDFFAIWQVPLSATQVGPAQGPVITYVNGQRDDTNPADIVLTAHERIQLDVGQDVPPYVFDFPPGD